MKTLDIEEKQNVTYCIPLTLRDEQIKINMEKVKGRLQLVEEKMTDPIALVSFGPSLQDTWQELKKFKYIMTCSGAHKFLIDKGIIPTYHVELEPREHKVKMLGEPHKDVEYLIASTIHPKYLDKLEGFNVKLWHIFATEEDGARILPTGELLVTGGSSVGLRCLTIARILGFTDYHIFGMDGSFSADSGTHTTDHPNAPSSSHYHETEYNGVKYLTTPSMLHVAKETWNELDQIADCKATFYGEGLVQAMSKDYIPKPKHGALITYSKPPLISKEYIDLNRKLHMNNPSYGMGGSKHAKTVLELSKANKTTSILDYGCGKGMLAKSLPFPIWEYDPAIPEKSAAPKPAEIVVCTDVLEHIEPDKLKHVLSDLKFLVKAVGYFVISTRKAVKTYANGQNTHLIVQGKDWWEKQLKKYFDIGTIIEKDDTKELHVVVGPKKPILPDMVTVEKDGFNFTFLTPNDTTKWRAKSLFTKEPSTIEWLDSIPKGDILYDIGANIGSYSVYAGVRGVKVYSFEPEAENFALLTKNMIINKLEPNAYNIALSDKPSLGMLYLGQAEVGGACHSFGEEVGHDLKKRPSAARQGCVSLTLDQLVEMGLPIPNHIKIDVDGFEEKVIKGAEKTLEKVKSLLVEINPAIPEHVEIIKYLKTLGFNYDEDQVDRATRKEGTFKGVAEYVFRQSDITSIIGHLSVPDVISTISIHQHVSTRNISALRYVSGVGRGPEKWAMAPTQRIDNFADIENVAMDLEPFNYLYVENMINNQDIYQKLKDYIATAKYTEIEKSRGTKGYPLRYTAPAPKEIQEIFMNGYLKETLLKKFGIKDEGFVEDLLLVRDLPGYKIPPHTDSTRKVITLLMYLPKEEMNEGTSIFEPKEKGFICKIGRHHEFDMFNKVKTMPFRPNSAFIFARTDSSFHGVEPSGNVRDVLLYNINRK